MVTRLSLLLLASSKIGLEAVRRNTGPGSPMGSTPRNTSGMAMAGSKGSMAMGNSSAHGICPFFWTAPFHASFHGERAILQKALLTVWVYSLLRNNFLRDFSQSKTAKKHHPAVNRATTLESRIHLTRFKLPTSTESTALSSTSPPPCYLLAPAWKSKAWKIGAVRPSTPGCSPTSSGFPLPRWPEWAERARFGAGAAPQPLVYDLL